MIDAPVTQVIRQVTVAVTEVGVSADVTTTEPIIEVNVDNGRKGDTGHSPVLTWIDDQIAIDGVVSGPHLKGPAGSDNSIKTYIQETRPTEVGPWLWWVTDNLGRIVNLIINDGV